MAFIPWPGPESRIAHRDGDGGPARLYLVEPGSVPPPTTGCLDDWVLLPASDDEVSARVSALMRRLRAHRPDGVAPYLDSVGVLHVGGRWVDLPPLEARLFAVLLEHLGEAVGTADLLRAGWTRRAGRPGNLRIQILRLRRRLDAVGLAIHTLPGRGYILDWASPDTAGPLPDKEITP